MAILDESNEFADRLPLNTGAPGIYNVGDVIDTYSPTINPNLTRDLAAGDAVYVVVVMTSPATSGGSAFLQFRLVSDDTNPPSTTTATVHVTSAPIPTALLTTGRPVTVQRLPSGAYEKYIGVQQVTGTAAFTGGTFSAFLTDDPNLWRPYGDNVL